MFRIVKNPAKTSENETNTRDRINMEDPEEDFSRLISLDELIEALLEFNL